MATRPYFKVEKNPPYFIEKQSASFKYESGFVLIQQQRCIDNLHAAIREVEKDCAILEVSTKSSIDLGKKLSAFSLDYLGISKYKTENVFQASKVFEHGGPYRELLTMKPWEAKKAEVLKTSGRLLCFLDLENEKWDIFPQTAYYDWIYIHSLDAYMKKHLEDWGQLERYSVFTDIAFNPEKSINCQARALAMYVGMVKDNAVDNYLQDKNSFLRLYNHLNCCEQISMWE